MELKDKLKERRIELDLTLDDIAREVGVSGATVSRWESGDIANMKRDRIMSYAKALKLSPGIIMGWEDVIAPMSHDLLDQHVDITNEGKTVVVLGKREVKSLSIPVLGSIAAGIPIDAIEDIVDYEEIDMEMANSGTFYGLKIKGSSMEPRIMENDVVIIKQQSDVESGEVGAVLINGNEATLKKVVKHENGISLISFNQAFEPKFFTTEEIESLPIKILGKVVELRGKF